MVVMYYGLIITSLFLIADTVKWHSMKSGYYSEYDQKVSIPITDIPRPKDGIDYYYRDHYIVRAYQGPWPKIIRVEKVKLDRKWFRWDKDSN